MANITKIEVSFDDGSSQSFINPPLTPEVDVAVEPAPEASAPAA